MKDTERDSCVNLFAAAILLLTVATELSALTVEIPPNSGIQALGVRPETPLIEHMPLGNLLNFEIDFWTPEQPLTFREGRVLYFDENGVPMLQQKVFGVATFDALAHRSGANPPGSGAHIPAGERIRLFFPFENLPFNVVPATVDIHLYFWEFSARRRECFPLSFRDIELAEYRPPPGQPYLFPLVNPTQNICQTGVWFTGHSHELLTGHRGAGNQRYAYDFGVSLRGSKGGGDVITNCNPACMNPFYCDCQASCAENEQWFAWEEDIVAIADGEVVLLGSGYPQNVAPGELDENAGLCNFTAKGLCDAIDHCPNQPDGFPGSGNQVVLHHDNGEYSTYAHMLTTEVICGETVSRGEVLGIVGNSGTSGAPHLHFSTLDKAGPEEPGVDNFPAYFNNIAFATKSGDPPKQQLDVSLPTNTFLSSILPAPVPIPPNPRFPGGVVFESEPNDSLLTHQALSVPTTVRGAVQKADEGEVAVRGDGIEDIYRIDLDAPGLLGFELTDFGASQNLDIYVADEELRILNPPRQGTSRRPDERVRLSLSNGTYYVFITNVDHSKALDSSYTLNITPLSSPFPISAGCVSKPASDCICTKEFAPVMCDQGTFANTCQARCACATGCVPECSVRRRPRFPLGIRPPSSPRPQRNLDVVADVPDPPNANVRRRAE